MLCHVCSYMMRGQEGRIWKGTYDLQFNHHKNVGDLRSSAKINCGVCRVLLEELKLRGGKDMKWDEPSISITASLFVPNPEVDQVYCLDFRMRYGQLQCQRSFVLKETGSSDPLFRTPVSHDTMSDEVHHLVSRWMSRCKCVGNQLNPSSYPTRLISLENFKKAYRLEPESDSITSPEASEKEVNSTSDPKDIKVKLVETADWENGPPSWGGKQYPYYITLSHCWGKNPTTKHKRAKLTKENIEKRRREGTRLRELPQTFAQAMQFAARFPDVGYIWIDTLCIKQDDTADWLDQSARMGEVYKNGFLNISATAASNSREGIFKTRKPELLLENEVLLNISGLPGVSSSPRASQSQRNRAYQGGRTVLTSEEEHLAIIEDVRDFSISSSNTLNIAAKTADLRRCTILDMSFWTDRVDKAPVNRRGWVLQERLMAPRVLHFCRDQVAWECKDFEAAEGLPEGIPNFQSTIDGIREGSRLKALNDVSEGRRLRRLRFHHSGDPDRHLRPIIYVLELWRRIVEVYSRTSVTNDMDKLIALSGLARWMSEMDGLRGVEERAQVRYASQKHAGRTTTTNYVAGLWTWNLASQLLWYVEPIFQASDGSFHHPTTAPTTYCAPSFSWASINVDQGDGIRYAEVTDQDILITIDEVSVTPDTRSNEFGLLEAAEMVLVGKLRKANFSASTKNKGRFKWRLMDRNYLPGEEHTFVFLDCPDRDVPGIIGPDAEVYVMPAAMSDRTTSKESKYLTCLILQLDKTRKEEPTFRRIGVTKLSTYRDHKALEDLAKIGDVMPHMGDDPKTGRKGYDPETGKHRILLI